MSTSSVFDRFGQPYDAVRVLDTSRLELNITAYTEYSPMYMPITYLTSYGTSFMLSIGILVHTVLFNGGEIWSRLLRRPVKGDVDIHMKLMRNYPDVPDWAYLAFLLVAFALSAVTVGVRPRPPLSISAGCRCKLHPWTGTGLTASLCSAGRLECLSGPLWSPSRSGSSM